MSQIELRFSEPKNWLMLSVQQSIERRMKRLEGRVLDDLPDLSFRSHYSSDNGAWIVAAAELEGIQVGVLCVEISWLFWRPQAIYGALALCNGTLLEFLGFRDRRDLLEVVVDGGRDQFRLTHLAKRFSLGRDTAVEWNHGPLPEAFQAPWLHSTDWYRQESVAFKMGKPSLEDHEVMPYVALCAWSRYQILRIPKN